MTGHREGEGEWSRRYKTNLERLRSGERDKIAEVMRGLSVLELERGLSTGEQRMLRRARQLLDEPPGGGGQAGVREPRRPLVPPSTGSAARSAIPGTP
jgi:hypothetical protein